MILGSSRGHLGSAGGPIVVSWVPYKGQVGSFGGNLGVILGSSKGHLGVI